MNKEPLLKYEIDDAVGNRIIVRLDQLPKKYKKADDVDNCVKTESGLYVVESAKDVDFERRRQEGAETGIVVSMGSTAYVGMGEPWCSVGDRVGFKRYAGINPYPYGSVDGFEYRCMEDEDICFRIKKQKEEEVENV